MTSLCTLLALDATNNAKICLIEVKIAFINRDLKEEIYMDEAKKFIYMQRKFSI